MADLVRRPRIVVLAALAAALVLALVLAVALTGGEIEAAPPEAPIEARAVVSPGTVLFGDTVTATVEITLDRSRVDPASVDVRMDFTPWQEARPPESERKDGSATTYLRTTYTLRCLVNACTFEGESASQDFDPARVAYVGREGTPVSGRRSFEVDWPQLFVGSRATATEGVGARASPWQADLLSMPEVSYGIAPRTLFALLLAGSGLFLVAAGALAYAGMPRRPTARPVPAQEPPTPTLTPLERALALLEDPMRMNGAPDQRRALEFVAILLARLGENELAGKARTLAWSFGGPDVAATTRLAGDARTALEEEEEHEAPR